MKKNYKKYVALALASLMAISTGTTAFADSSQSSAVFTDGAEATGNVIITDDGVTINGVYYTKDQFIQLLNEAELASSENTRIAAGIYFVPGIGQIAIAATGVIVVAGAVVVAGSWLYDSITNALASSSARAIAKARAKIPSRLHNDDGDVDLGQFDQKVSGKNSRKESGGWTIDKDTAGHGGKKWKLKDKSGKRVASLGENGEVLGK